MASYKLFKLKTYPAHAGPSLDFINQHSELIKERVTPTREGRYIVYSIGKHVSSQRWLFSSIAWGTPMKFEKEVVYVQKNGKWVKLSATNSQWLSGGNSEKDLHDYLIKLYVSYKQNNVRLYSNGMPGTWVFNDFGHVSVKYFKDTNDNFKLDKNESLMSDFIHTTPVTEAVSSFNKQNIRSAQPVQLVSSHGCIHVRPDDIDEMIRNKYIEKGSAFVVHPYHPNQVSENVIVVNNNKRFPVTAFEVHFFPRSSTNETISGSGELVIYSIKKN